MRCVIPQITWNTQQQMLSIDFDPSCKAEDGFYRLVTVGADSKMLVWYLRDPNTLKPKLQLVDELSHHQKAINVVRFSPSGQMIASGDDDSIIMIWTLSKTEDGEKWNCWKNLRKHLGDVTDLSWSFDSKYLLSSSIDNTVVYWDVEKGTSKFIWNEHTGFVQGVSFDPLHDFAATICLDRTLRLYDAKTGQLKTKVSKYPPGWVIPSKVGDENSPDIIVETPPPRLPEPIVPQNPTTPTTTSNLTNGEKPKKSLNPNKLLGNHMFHDDTLATFCRRLTFSVRGEFLLVPAGVMPCEKKLESTTTTTPPITQLDESLNDSISEPAKKKVKKEGKTTADENAVILFCRNDFSIPCAVIPTGSSYSIACRFCPLYFHRGESTYAYDEGFVNPVKKDERRISCVGKLDLKEERENNILMDAPYRSVYAIATNNAVIIGATDRTEPLAIVKNIHFARLTDLAWSPDGRVIVTSSTDGYVSIITFEDSELGIPVGFDVIGSNPACLPIPVKETKVNIIKPKKKPQRITPITLDMKSPKSQKPTTNCISEESPKPMTNGTSAKSPKPTTNGTSEELPKTPAIITIDDDDSTAK